VICQICLRVLESALLYCYIPSEVLPQYIACLCCVVNRDKLAQQTWTVSYRIQVLCKFNSDFHFILRAFFGMTNLTALLRWKRVTRYLQKTDFQSGYAADMLLSFEILQSLETDVEEIQSLTQGVLKYPFSLLIFPNKCSAYPP